MNKSRLKSLSALMKAKKLDAIILTTLNDTSYNENIFYYTGFVGNGLFIFKKSSKKPTLIVSPIEYEKAKKTGVDAELITKENRSKVLQKVMGSPLRIGIDKRNTLVSQYEELKTAAKNISRTKKKKSSKFIDVSRQLTILRSIKEKEEIESIRSACNAGDKIFGEIIKNFKFSTEKELAAFIDIKIRENEMTNSFSPIVSSGKSASDIHHNPSGKIGRGFLILDFGCRKNGYCSDMTRTLFVGTPTIKEKEMYKEVLRVQENAIAKAKIGKRCSDLDSRAREELGEKFVHSLGHGVGLEIHEFPNLNRISKDILKENMVFTIEPGIYKEGKFGIRIEDTVLLTKKGAQSLTKSPKNLICVKLS